jgi:TetR/AcrR family transcriptional regulator, repressor for neighboring sulfatase
MPTEGTAKGREAVETALIEAACNLLAEVGPRATSVRDIASQAGVNHGQVHHYFGSKRGLLKQAMKLMAEEHYHAMRALSDGPVPPALTLPEDKRYWQAVIRATIEGDDDLARTEVESGVSVIRDVLDHVTFRAGLEAPTLDIKVSLAATAAMHLGWLALERFIFMTVDIKPEEEELVREEVRQSVMRTRSTPLSQRRESA